MSLEEKLRYAYETIQDRSLPVDHSAKKLAGMILTEFDPQFFEKKEKDRKERLKYPFELPIVPEKTAYSRCKICKKPNKDLLLYKVIHCDCTRFTKSV